MTTPRPVLWGKTELVRLEHFPARQITRVVERYTERLIAEVPGHPSDPETHDLLARALRDASKAIQADLRLVRAVYADIRGRRPAA
jgi:hypothetical protein